MIRCLLVGTLHTDPQARTSQTGKPYCTGKLKADASDGNTVWCSLVAGASWVAVGGRESRATRD